MYTYNRQHQTITIDILLLIRSGCNLYVAFKLVQLLSVENRKELCNLGKFIHLACKAIYILVWLTCVFIIIVHNFLTYLCYFLICHIYMLYTHVIITCHIVYWWTVMFKVNKEFELAYSIESSLWLVGQNLTSVMNQCGMYLVHLPRISNILY